MTNSNTQAVFADPIKEGGRWFHNGERISRAEAREIRRDNAKARRAMARDAMDQDALAAGRKASRTAAKLGLNWATQRSWFNTAVAAVLRAKGTPDASREGRAILDVGPAKFEEYVAYAALRFIQPAQPASTAARGVQAVPFAEDMLRAA